MNQWKLVPCEPTPEMAAVFIPESCKTGSWIDGYKAMLNAAPAPDVQPVAWSVFDKRTQKHWYTNESVNTAGYYAKEYSHREPDGSPSMLVVPLYTHPPVAPDVQPVGKFAQFTDGGWREVTAGSAGVPLYEHPPAADVQELERSERYQMQMTAISTASLGYWKEGDAISPEYDTVALRDVAKMYGRYEAARADALELVEALQDLCDTLGECGMTEKARVVLTKWVGK